MSEIPPVVESAINLIAEGTRIEGKIRLDHVSRVHGCVSGQIEGASGSLVVIAETGWVEGNIDADSVVIDGFVRGDIAAKTRIKISRTGRVVGNLKAPKVALDFGSYLEGSCKTEAPAEATASP